MDNKVAKNVISYVIIASIFITGMGYETGDFKFYWYYPFYILFTIYGLLVYHKINLKIFGIVSMIIVYALLTYELALNLVIKQIINIGFSSIVFYLFLCHEKFDITSIFRKYITFSKVMAIIGFTQVFLFALNLGFILLFFFPFLKSYDVSTRLQSLTQEPSYIAFTFSPIVFIALHNLFYRTGYFMTKRWSYLFVICYLLTQSAIAYLGLLVMLCVLYFKNFSYLKLQLAAFALAGVIMIGFVSYQFVPGIKFRIDDTLTGLSSDFFEDDTYLKVNPSTYAILSNYHITTKSLKDHPITGNGLGTYEAVYDKYIPAKVNNARRGYFKINRQDGASMAFRLLVETGLIGFFLFCFFVARYKMKSKAAYTKEIDVLWVLNCGIFILILLALLRNGNYTIHGKLLFFFLYYYIYKEARVLLKSPAQLNLVTNKI